MMGEEQELEMDCTLPRDPDDERFVLSFTPGQLTPAQSFFSCFGFVVFRDVFSEEECERTRSSMWQEVERNNPGVSRDDPLTWNVLKTAGKFGLGMRGPCFHPQLVRNRCNPNLIQILEAIIGEDDVMVSHDRFTIYRAAKHNPQYKTGDRNVHLDLNPWWWCDDSPDVLQGVSTLSYEDPQDFIKENNLVVKSMGCHVQCVLNFEDNEDVDGGTILVPKFHRHIEEWCRRDDEVIIEHRKMQDEEQRKNLELKKGNNCDGTKNKCQESSGAKRYGAEVVAEERQNNCNARNFDEHHNTHNQPKRKKNSKAKQGSQKKPSPVFSDSDRWGCGVRLRDPKPWVILSNDSRLSDLAQRIPMRRGSVLVWDQTMVHGTQPNDSERCRMAMFLKAFSRSKTFQGDNGERRRLRRQVALKRFITAGVEECGEGKVSVSNLIGGDDLQRDVFDLQFS